MTDPITIWGVGTTRTMRAHWMAHELGLNYRTRRIESRTGETTDADYSALNPKQKIPLLVHGDLVVSESFAITRYLRQISDSLPFDDYQLSTAGQAKYDEWLSYILMELDATSLYVVRRHKDLPDIYGEAPAAIESSITYFERMLNSTADQVHAGQPLWGSCFSELDVLFTITLDWAGFLDIPMPDNVLGYQRAMQARVAYQTARQHNFRDLQIQTLKSRD